MKHHIARWLLALGVCLALPFLIAYFIIAEERRKP